MKNKLMKNISNAENGLASRDILVNISMKYKTQADLINEVSEILKSFLMPNDEINMKSLNIDKENGEGALKILYIVTTRKKKHNVDEMIDLLKE